MDDLIRQALVQLRSMWRFRWWGLGVAWLGFAVAAIVIYAMPDRFESSARVYVDTQSVLRPLMSGLAVQPDVDQQIRILSRTLITRPNVEKLINMADLDHQVINAEQRERLITQVMNDLSIRAGRGDNLFTLAFQDSSPERAQRVVQSLVAMFVESGLGGKRQDTGSARRFLEDQISNYEQKLTAAESRVKDFRLRHLGMLNSSGSDYVQQINQATLQLSQARLELEESVQSLAAYRRQEAQMSEMVPVSDSQFSPALTPELDGRIESLKASLDTLLQRYTESHPDVMGVRRVMADLEVQREQVLAARQAAMSDQPEDRAGQSNPMLQQMQLLIAEAESRVAALRARVSQYEEQLKGLRERAEMVPRLEAEFAQLNRDYEVMQRNYQSLVQRRESANMSVEMDAQSGVAEFRVIEPPSLPHKPSAPNRVLLLVVAGLAALGGGAALTFLIAQLRPTFFDAQGLREITGLPVLGTVTRVDSAAQLARSRYGRLAFAAGVTGYAGVVVAVAIMLKLMQG